MPRRERDATNATCIQPFHSLACARDRKHAAAGSASDATDRRHQRLANASESMMNVQRSMFSVSTTVPAGM